MVREKVCMCETEGVRERRREHEYIFLPVCKEDLVFLLSELQLLTRR